MNSPKAELEAERRARRLQSAAAMSVRLMSGGITREMSSASALSAAANANATGDRRRSSSTAKIVTNA